MFTPVAIESSGVFGTETLKFVNDLGHRLKLASGENSVPLPPSKALSSCRERGNAASVMGFLGSEQMEDFLCNLCLFVVSCIILLLFKHRNTYTAIILNIDCAQHHSR